MDVVEFFDSKGYEVVTFQFRPGFGEYEILFVRPKPWNSCEIVKIVQDFGYTVKEVDSENYSICALLVFEKS